MKNIKMVVFDMAGTAIDEDNVVYKTLQKAINEAGYEFTLDEVLESGAGKEKLQAIKDILKREEPSRDESFAALIYTRFMTLLTTAYETQNIVPQKGAEELFRILKNAGILVILNTGYDFKTAQSILVKTGLSEGDQIDAMITATHVKHNRPKPDMIIAAMEKYGLSDPTEVVKVGDSAIDIEEGKNAGCAINIGITTGAHTREQLNEANPEFIIDNLMEIVAILEIVTHEKAN